MKLEHKRFQERRIEGPARALTRVFVDLKASPEKEKLRLSTTIESVEFQTNTRPRAAAGPSFRIPWSSSKPAIYKQPALTS
ncbi:MAG: hypothetical protein DMG60_04260 [Acidobacteria bacterium]|nr:MAG: hypothetical protein DMG60_04260 [Acidobacteriota bacterium]